jgi:hypothetical protein
MRLAVTMLRDKTHRIRAIVTLKLDKIDDDDESLYGAENGHCDAGCRPPDPEDAYV